MSFFRTLQDLTLAKQRGDGGLRTKKKKKKKRKNKEEEERGLV